ncbi:MAG TPA: BON domain-containing protein [Paraburkholderia sp.]|nr:BON domain-containing protein [Paraburkholderia sp.]
MNAVDLLKVLVVSGCMAGASCVYAQSSDGAATSGDAATAAPAPSAKQMHAADRKLARDVRRAMAKAQGFDVSNVFVRARSGAVTLTGSVPEGDQIAQAGEIAKGVAGVKSVSNRVTLGVQGGGN